MELRLKARTTAQRVGIVVLLTLASIAFHEFGHFVVYRLEDCPVRITLQSVRPIGNVSALWDAGYSLRISRSDWSSN
jgi:hypothetical protein